MIRSRTIASIATGLLLVSGCASTDSGSQADSNDAQDASGDQQGAGGGTSAEDIITTIEGMGFECEEQDRHLDIVSLAIECRGDDYMFLTASQFFDPAERDDHFENSAIPIVCEEVSSMDEVAWSVRDDWLLVPGGGRDKDVAALDEASEKLGFDVSTQACD